MQKWPKYSPETTSSSLKADYVVPNLLFSQQKKDKQ